MADMTEEDQVLETPFASPDVDGASPFAEDAPKKRGRPKGSRNRTASTAGSRKAASPRPRRSDPMPHLLGLGWAGLGFAFEHVGPEPFGAPVGRVLQLQAPVAGDTLTKALKKTPAYGMVKPFMDAVGPWTELAQLFALPIMTAAVAMKPEVLNAPPIQAMFMSQLVPAIAQAKQRAEEQKQLTEELSQFTPEARQEAQAVMSWLIGVQPEEEAPEPEPPAPEPNWQDPEQAAEEHFPLDPPPPPMNDFEQSTNGS